MKRSDIKLQTSDIVKECQREIQMRRKVFGDQVMNGRLSEYQANKRILIIIQFKELAEQMERKGINWKQLTEMVEQFETIPKPKQSTFNFPA